MAYFVYILYSSKIDRYYVGFSTDVNNRLSYHSSVTYNRIWTKRGIPWDLKFKQAFADKRSALKAEKYIKRMKSRVFIENLIKNGQLIMASDPD